MTRWQCRWRTRLHRCMIRSRIPSAAWWSAWWSRRWWILRSEGLWSASGCRKWWVVWPAGPRRGFWSRCRRFDWKLSCSIETAGDGSDLFRFVFILFMSFWKRKRNRHLGRRRKITNKPLRQCSTQWDMRVGHNYWKRQFPANNEMQLSDTIGNSCGFLSWSSTGCLTDLKEKRKTPKCLSLLSCTFR